jgi:hypothetical protein
VQISPRAVVAFSIPLKHHQYLDMAVEVVSRLRVDRISSEESEGDVGSERRRFHIRVEPCFNTRLTYCYSLSIVCPAMT